MIGVITIAHGPQRYIDLAIHMVQSLYLTNPGVQTAVVTDQVEHPQLTRTFHYVIPLDTRLGKGLIHKFYLYEYSPFEETLFIDSDCLVMGSLDHLIERCFPYSFVALGQEITSGEWYMDVEKMRQRFALPSIPKFNGGFYYFKKDSLAAQIYHTAQALVREYDQNGFTRFRNSVNEEPVIAVSMAIHQVKAIEDEGLGMRTPLGLESDFQLDFLSGVVRFKKEGTWVKPVIVHFCGSLAEGFHYRREKKKVLMSAAKYPIWLIRCLAFLQNSQYSLLVLSKRLVKALVRGEKFKWSPLLPLYSNH